MSESFCRRFILQALAPSTGCPILEAQFSLDALGPLFALLGEEAGENLDGSYELDAADIRDLSKLIGFVFPDNLGPVRLLRWHPLRAVPYLIHTGFELPLMLEGRKPLAVFSEAYPSEWFEAMIARFDPHVAARRFVKHVIDEPFSALATDGVGSIGIRHVYIALPDQEWRIDAYIGLMEADAKSGWTEQLERRQGELLGYEDWQCDWWAAERKTVLSRRR